MKIFVLELLAQSTFGLLKLARMLRDEGVNDEDILRVFRTYIALKKHNIFCMELPLCRIGSIINEIDLLAWEELLYVPGDETEQEFIERLVRSGISYKARVRIGMYKILHLIKNSLVLNLDGIGPDRLREFRARRDAFLNLHGIAVLRLPPWLMTMAPEAMIDEIKTHLNIHAVTGNP